MKCLFFCIFCIFPYTLHMKKLKKYTDYAIISGLSSRRGKRDFVSFVDEKLELTIDDTPENRVFALSQIHQKETLEESYIFDLESDLIGVLSRMEIQGVAFDREKLTDIGERLRSDIRRIEGEIHELIGFDININSPKQLQVLFFETLGIKPLRKNKTGYSVDVDVLEEIAKTHDVARLILEYRSLAKLSTTYVDGLMKSIDP